MSAIHASPSDWANCRAAIREGSQSFHAASLLLPSSVRDPAFSLYAFCRDADDRIDSEKAGQIQIAQLRHRLDLVYADRPDNRSIDRTFADTVHKFAIPKTLPLALLEGLEWDINGQRYRNISELYAYAARVASAVGAMMTLLMGVRSPQALARACDLGIAMQLTNIARDVGEDARMGRIYLPLDWMEEAKIDVEAFLKDPDFTPELGNIVQRLLYVAEQRYQRALSGIGLLPTRCRPGIGAARLIYREIGRVIAAKDYDSVTARAVVPKQRKMVLLGEASLLCLPGTLASDQAEKPLPEVEFLVQAVMQNTAATPSVFAHPFWRIGAQVDSILELFLRMQQRDQVRQTAHHS